MENYCLKLNKNADVDIIWQLLEENGINVLYSDEDPLGNKEIYITHSGPSTLDFISQLVPELIRLDKIALPEIDWEDQWKLHGYHFHEGCIWIELDSFGFKGSAQSIIKLEPGPGFGDLSHPTTALMLTLMANKMKGQTVVDIGCGSGVLSIAAVAMGAKRVVAIDIDAKALDHTFHNAKLNQMNSQIEVLLPDEMEKMEAPVTVLINMISSEQMIAWNSIKDKIQGYQVIYSSGIPIEEKEAYLNLTSQWGWKVINTLEKDGWLGFEFNAI